MPFSAPKYQNTDKLQRALQIQRENTGQGASRRRYGAVTAYGSNRQFALGTLEVCLKWVQNRLVAMLVPPKLAKSRSSAEGVSTLKQAVGTARRRASRIMLRYCIWAWTDSHLSNGSRGRTMEHGGFVLSKNSFLLRVACVDYSLICGFRKETLSRDTSHDSLYLFCEYFVLITNDCISFCHPLLEICLSLERRFQADIPHLPNGMRFVGSFSSFKLQILQVHYIFAGSLTTPKNYVDYLSATSYQPANMIVTLP